jgi:hypothetical protein
MLAYISVVCLICVQGCGARATEADIQRKYNVYFNEARLEVARFFDLPATSYAHIGVHIDGRTQTLPIKPHTANGYACARSIHTDLPLDECDYMKATFQVSHEYGHAFLNWTLCTDVHSLLHLWFEEVVAHVVSYHVSQVRGHYDYMKENRQVYAEEATRRRITLDPALFYVRNAPIIESFREFTDVNHWHPALFEFGGQIYPALLNASHGVCLPYLRIAATHARSRWWPRSQFGALLTAWRDSMAHRAECTGLAERISKLFHVDLESDRVWLWITTCAAGVCTALTVWWRYKYIIRP